MWPVTKEINNSPVLQTQAGQFRQKRSINGKTRADNIQYMLSSNVTLRDLAFLCGFDEVGTFRHVWGCTICRVDCVDVNFG